MLSVIVPTRNRAELLELALHSLAQQTLSPSNFEIIVVDNGSRDSTSAVAAQFEKRSAGRIRYVYEASPGLHVGRHYGLRKADGDIVVFMDDDIEAFPTLLSTIAAAFEDSQTALVGGKCLPKHEGPAPEWLSAMWAPNAHGERILGYLSLIDLGEFPKLVDPVLVFGCNFSIRRSVLVEAGGFHPDGVPQRYIRFRGDGETYVSRYIARRGYKALYHPGASIYHHVPRSRTTLEYLCQRAYNQGISNSYTNIRTTHGLDSDVQSSKGATQHSDRARRKKIGEIISSMQNRAARLLQIRPTEELIKFQDIYLGAIAAAYEAGYAFHQAAAHESEMLLEWVLRSDYWDAQVPSEVR